MVHLVPMEHLGAWEALQVVVVVELGHLEVEAALRRRQRWQEQ